MVSEVELRGAYFDEVIPISAQIKVLLLRGKVSLIAFTFFSPLKDVKILSKDQTFRAMKWGKRERL